MMKRLAKKFIKSWRKLWSAVETCLGNTEDENPTAVNEIVSEKSVPEDDDLLDDL